ncbi:putative DNA primase/helicase [Rhodoligotrophos appendicifer]|uniref:phage/plasmid primase, P4 family n=1 Tax=Rhodoligotrophos appendicifer TaxID=987056 RepID=UPI0011860E09|nr:phage/plasmid primase, P4 family [Rhodoligotrophos appendicifer]
MTRDGQDTGAGQLLAAALDYARRGWPVFPCSPSQTKGESKQPLTPKSSPGKKDGGLYLATTDEAQVRAWWERFPKALIGMPTGVRAGVFVVDLDPRKFSADDMLESLAGFCGGVLPPCPVVRTQSGGLHLWFAYPDMPESERLGNRAGLFAKIDDIDVTIAEHVDIRGEGGYVIVPPSIMVDGAAYSWEQAPEGDPVCKAPARLLDVILRRGEFARGQAPAAQAMGFEADDAVRKYALSALDAEARALAAAAAGSRNQHAAESSFKIGQLVGAGALSRSMAIAALTDAALSWGIPSNDKALGPTGTIARSIDAGAAQPRDLSDIRRKAEERARRYGAHDRRPEAPFPEHPHGPAAPDDDGGGDEPPEDGVAILGDGTDWEAIKACAQLEQNDTDNGQRLLIHFGDQIIHVRDLGWAAWSDSHFELKGGSEAVERLAQKAAKLIALEGGFLQVSDRDRKLISDLDQLLKLPKDGLSKDQEAAMAAGTEARDRLAKRKSDRRKFSISCGNSSRLSGMIGRALAHCTVAQDQLDADPQAINLINGVIDVRRIADLECPDPDVTRFTAEIVFTPTHDPKRLMSKRMEVRYDPAAKCPQWLAALERFQPNPEMRRYLQKLHGYCLMGLTGEQSLWFNYGGGSNWKSTFIRVIATLMGSYATAIPFASLVNEQTRGGNQASPDIALLPRMRMAHASEPPKDQRWDEAVMKRLTGGEMMQARGLYQAFFEFRPTHKLVVAGNDKPPVSGVDHGTWRRMKLLPWTVTISEDEKRDMDDVVAEYLAEGSGILNWLLEGIRFYFEEGLKPPELVREATREYRDENDPVGPFMAACVRHLPGGSVTAREMYEAFCQYTEANGGKPISEHRFGRLLPQKGLKKTDERIRRYLDVELHDVPRPSRSPGDDWHNRDG